MSLIQPEFLPPREDTLAPDAAGGGERGLRPEDALRGVVIGVLVLLGGLALGNFTFQQITTRGTPYFIVVACIAVVLIAFAYQKFQPVLVLFIAAMSLSVGGTPDLAQGGSGSGKGLYPVEIEAAFLLFVWVLRGIGQKQFRIARTPMNGILIIYLAYSVWSAVNGWLFWDPAVSHFYAGVPGGGKTAPLVIVLELTLRVLSIGMFWLMASNLNDPKWVHWAGWLLLLPGLCVLLTNFHLLPSIVGGWPTLLEFVLGCTLWAFILEKEGTPRTRFFAGLLLAVLIFQVFFLNIRWISGWIGLFSGLAFVTFLKSKRLLVALLCVAAVLVFLSQPFLKARVVQKVQTSGDLDRFSMQRGAVLYALHFPLGIGPGNFRAYNVYYGSRAMWNTTTYTSAHNFYGQALAETGFPGLILVLVWVVTGIVMLVRFCRRAPPGPGRIRLLGIAGMWAGISTSAYLGDYLIPVYHNGGLSNMTATVYAWIGLGVAVAQARQLGVLSDPKAEAQAAPTPVPIGAQAPRRMMP